MLADLSARVDAVTASALASGALQPIPNQLQHVEAEGLRWIVHAMPSLQRKANAAPPPAESGDAAKIFAGRPKFDPFAAPEAALVVAQVPPAHVALLNKFNIVDRHLLIVTREFEHQLRLLSEADFDALGRCMENFDGLAFYNAGLEAGASQAHKHLQIVPMTAPLETWFDAVKGFAIGTVPQFGFRHAIARIAPGAWDHPGRSLATLYRELLATCRIGGMSAEDGERQSAPYNLLITRRWMLVVPRTTGKYETIHVSALNFAGSFFVRGEADVAKIRAVGPMAILAATAPAA